MLMNSTSVGSRIVSALTRWWSQKLRGEHAGFLICPNASFLDGSVVCSNFVCVCSHVCVGMCECVCV